MRALASLVIWDWGQARRLEPYQWPGGKGLAAMRTDFLGGCCCGVGAGGSGEFVGVIGARGGLGGGGCDGGGNTGGVGGVGGVGGGSRGVVGVNVGEGDGGGEEVFGGAGRFVGVGFGWEAMWIESRRVMG